MLTKLLTATAFTAITVLMAGAAWSQDAGATCKPLGEDDCRKASACRWTSTKVLALPNGTPVTIPGVCRFKPGVAAAIKAAAAAPKQ